MRRLILGLLLIGVACGQPQARPATSPLAGVTVTPTATSGQMDSDSPTPSAATSPSTTASPAPSTSPTLLFAVLEARGSASFNTVAVAGVDGFARAKTTFAPMRVPTVGCTGTALTPVSAHVAAGKVYFADGAGVVRSLSLSGQIVKVATFPL